MAVKQFAPVRVTNPLSDMHMVYLHPNQPFVLELSSWMGVQYVDWDSDFFKQVTNYTDNEGTRCFLFEPTCDLTEWSKYSNTYLGEVTLISNEICTTLCVVLLSKNPFVLTLLNPTSCEIKVQPHQIIEFVFWGDQAESIIDARSISSGHLGMVYKEKGQEVTYPTDTLLPDAMTEVGDFVVRQRNSKQKEHHFWYQLPDDAICKANGLPNAIYHGGKITFGSDLKRSIDISLSVKKREPKKPRTQSSTTTIITPTKQQVFQYSQKYTYYQKDYWREPNVADVEINYKGQETLADGCRVIDFNELETYVKEERGTLGYYHGRISYDYRDMYD
jgi:hypothetical protein